MHANNRLASHWAWKQHFNSVDILLLMGLLHPLCTPVCVYQRANGRRLTPDWKCSVSLQLSAGGRAATRWDRGEFVIKYLCVCVLLFLTLSLCHEASSHSHQPVSSSSVLCLLLWWRVGCLRVTRTHTRTQTHRIRSSVQSTFPPAFV